MLLVLLALVMHLEKVFSKLKGSANFYMILYLMVYIRTFITHKKKKQFTVIGTEGMCVSACACECACE